MSKTPNPLAVALAKMGKGVKKTMTPAAVRQRQEAVKSRWAKVAKARAKKKRRRKAAVKGGVKAPLLFALACLGLAAAVALSGDPAPAPEPHGYAIRLEGGLEIHP